ncbi:TlyA family RNA methyltransferase [Candidatus Falkowbacteria bacterium]|nr:TlyA family RNA methyltransferase [Candidatus Falkowbacteria bacterium]
MEKKPLVRLDRLLVRLGYAQSRERANALIKAGHVLVDGKPITKVATPCAPDATVEMIVEDVPWVSRAGLKLEKALETWPINITNAVCLDIGASTGGFTDVLLHRGAKKVYALDVGHDQLAQRLRDDQRVITMEDKNIRAAVSAWFAEPLDVVTVDVSFISLKHVLPKVTELLRDGGEAVVLIKPQFEVGREHIRKGVVRDPALHKQVIDTIKTLAVKERLTPVDLMASPIKGVGGNEEFLLYLKKSPRASD